LREKKKGRKREFVGSWWRIFMMGWWRIFMMGSLFLHVV
jgi:hypothetical protein